MHHFLPTKVQNFRGWVQPSPKNSMIGRVQTTYPELCIPGHHPAAAQPVVFVSKHNNKLPLLGKVNTLSHSQVNIHTTAAMKDSTTSTSMQANLPSTTAGFTTGKEAATSGAKQLQSTPPGFHSVSIHKMAPPEWGNTHPDKLLTTECVHWVCLPWNMVAPCSVGWLGACVREIHAGL